MYPGNRKKQEADSGLLSVLFLATACVIWPRTTSQYRQGPFDLMIHGGRIIDGSGGRPYMADIGIRADRIAMIGNLYGASGRRAIDATHRVVSPGFIDMLGQSETALLIDNRSLSKLSQGITTEVTGEGSSPAPQNEKTL